MKTLQLRKSIGRSPWRRGFLLIPLVLVCFALSPASRAQLPPPAPDGGYPGANTAEGTGALFSLTTGFANTATGALALVFNKGGSYNTATGAIALEFNTAGINNTANGAFALQRYETGSYNTATGFSALKSNIGGTYNTANGAFALQSNIGGTDNVANGAFALQSNTTGSDNTANGEDALISNKTGAGNTATGSSALYSNTTGIENTANGDKALLNNTTGSGNIALGASAGDNIGTGGPGDDNIEIGNEGGGFDTGTIRIGTQGTQGAAFIAGIYGATTSDAASTTPVLIDANGNLGTAASSERFKKDIGPMDKASEAVLALKPVTFHYRNDTKTIPQFGLAAEEVEKVSPDLITRDADGKPYSVRYDAVNAMLLNEFLKEHHQVQHLKAIVAEQQKQIKALTAGLQKVSAQVEMSKPAPQTVLNNQ